ncbi:hypothetical protein BT69DRAFT_1293714 [Atractiella rhizophila]|nr:hypothetical protein BT69DRAFT_1293714 [Atractiella rhizophila]
MPSMQSCHSFFDFQLPQANLHRLVREASSFLLDQDGFRRGQGVLLQRSVVRQNVENVEKKQKTNLERSLEHLGFNLKCEAEGADDSNSKLSEYRCQADKNNETDSQSSGTRTLVDGPRRRQDYYVSMKRQSVDDPSVRRAENSGSERRPLWQREKNWFIVINLPRLLKKMFNE